MKRNAYIIGVYAAIAAAGFFSIFTLPCRNQVAPVEAIPEHEVTLDEALERQAEEAEKRKLYLDSLLESAELEKMAAMTSQDAENATETESWYILPLETETAEFEPISRAETETETEPETTLEIFTPVSSLMASDLQAWVYAYGTQEGVDPYIIMAICERESCCISDIMGDSGRAYGIMQIQIQWVPDKLANHGYTAADMLKAQPNIIIGVEILKDYLNTGNGYEWALEAYNGGVNSVGTEQTRQYAAWVMNRADELRTENEKG